jgi:hypothetical protein
LLILHGTNNKNGLSFLLINQGLLLNNPMGTGAFGKPISPGKKACTIHGNKRPSSSPVDHLMLSPEAKKMRFQSSMRLLKDEPVPDGYVRFRYVRPFNSFLLRILQFFKS